MSLRILLSILLSLLLPSLCLAQVSTSPGGISYLSPSLVLVAQGGAGWTNTGLSTSEENLVSIPIPALLPNDQLRIYTLWTRGGTITDTDNLVIRLSSSSCTPQTICNSGTALLNIAGTTASTTTFNGYTFSTNRGATNSQVAFNAASTAGFGQSSGATTTAAVQTNSGAFININCQTATSSADSCTLEAYSIEIVRHN